MDDIEHVTNSTGESGLRKSTVWYNEGGHRRIGDCTGGGIHYIRDWPGRSWWQSTMAHRQ